MTLQAVAEPPAPPGQDDALPSWAMGRWPALPVQDLPGADHVHGATRGNVGQDGSGVKAASVLLLRKANITDHERSCLLSLKNFTAKFYTHRSQPRVTERKLWGPTKAGNKGRGLLRRTQCSLDRDPQPKFLQHSPGCLSCSLQTALCHAGVTRPTAREAGSCNLEASEGKRGAYPCHSVFYCSLQELFAYLIWACIGNS